MSRPCDVLQCPTERLAMTTCYDRMKASFFSRLSLLFPITLLCLGIISASAAAPATDAGQLSATLPNGRRITPAGGWIKVAPFPYTLAIRPDGNQVVVPSIGWPFSLNIIDHPGSAAAKTSVERIPAARKNDPQLQVATGIAYSPDGRLLYDATGDTGAIHIFSTATWKRVTEVPLNGVTRGKSFAQSYSAAVALTP